MAEDVKSLPEGKATSLSVERLRNGGFIVSDGVRRMGELNCPVFAASELEEALDWIKAAFVGRFESARPKPSSDRMAVGD